VDFLFSKIKIIDLKKYIKTLSENLSKWAVSTQLKDECLVFKNGHTTLEYFVLTENSSQNIRAKKLLIPLDILVRESSKLTSGILSKLKLNKVVYARNCNVEKITKNVAENFLNTYHVLNKTTSGFNFGLFYKDELLAVASFSKGRKMNRLAADLRSFELIRFCSKTGITIAGGLTKLLQYFISSRKVGDIMTYVDKQYSDGSSFFKSGFELHSETKAQTYLIDRKTFKRFAIKNLDDFDKKKYYLFSDSGNLKLIYKPKIA
jgi:hypothetical protein